MNKLCTLGCMVALSFLLVSNSANPPDGHTGAPGESFCTNCHSLNGSANTGTISVEGFPASITPQETYKLTVVNRNTNDGAVKAGFQITILSPTNTKAGNMTLLPESISCIVSNSGGRQYFEHNPSVVYPDSNVVKWVVNWKAPALATGSKITWYADGIIANGNAKETGDRTVTAKGSGTIVIAGTEDLAKDKPKIYPNPGSDMINILLPDQTRPDGQVYFYNILGNKISGADIHEGVVNTPLLPPGVYLLEIRYGNKSYVARWTKI